MEDLKLNIKNALLLINKKEDIFAQEKGLDSLIQMTVNNEQCCLILGKLNVISVLKFFFSKNNPVLVGHVCIFYCNMATFYKPNIDKMKDIGLPDLTFKLLISSSNEYVVTSMLKLVDVICSDEECRKFYSNIKVTHKLLEILILCPNASTIVWNIFLQVLQQGIFFKLFATFKK